MLQVAEFTAQPRRPPAAGGAGGEVEPWAGGWTLSETGEGRPDVQGGVSCTVSPRNEDTRSSRADGSRERRAQGQHLSRPPRKARSAAGEPPLSGVWQAAASMPPPLHGAAGTPTRAPEEKTPVPGPAGLPRLVARADLGRAGEDLVFLGGTESVEGEEKQYSPFLTFFVCFW